MQNKLRWCFGLKGGLKIVESNEELAKSYLQEAKISLKRAQTMFENKDYLWTTVILYYAEYYALYSFLQKIGVKCENHFCSILAVEHLLGEEKIKTIKEQRDKRIDAQYYMKIVEEEKIKEMLNDAKIFISQFDEIVSGLNQKEIDSYREQLQNLRRSKNK